MTAIPTEPGRPATAREIFASNPWLLEPYIPEIHGDGCVDPQCTDENPCTDCAAAMEQEKADAARERVTAHLRAVKERREALLAEQRHQLEEPTVEAAFAHLAIDHPNAAPRPAGGSREVPYERP